MPASENDRQLILVALARMARNDPAVRESAREIARGLQGAAMFENALDPERGRRLSITCPVCAWTSFSADDVAHRYCGHCHKYHDEMTGDEIADAFSGRVAAEFMTAAVRRTAATPPGRVKAAVWSGLALALLAAARVVVDPRRGAGMVALDALVGFACWTWGYHSGRLR